MMEVTKKMAAAAAAFEAAKETAAKGGEFAPDYVDYKGIRFYYKTVAHAWVLIYLTNLPPAVAGTAMLYALAHPAEEVRNVVMPQVLDGSIATAAVDFFIGRGISSDDLDGLDRKLLEHPYASGDAENPTHPA